MALMNLLSSTINQWSVLSGLIPVIYSLSKGEPSAIVFDVHQRQEAVPGAAGPPAIAPGR